VFDLFPGYVLADHTRHPQHVLVCPDCGALNEVDDQRAPGACQTCHAVLRREGPARRGHCVCPDCGQQNTYPRPANGPLTHRLFAIEYVNPARKAEHRGRFFKQPDAKDLQHYANAVQQWQTCQALFTPAQAIPPGDETTRLHRWGYTYYHELFNARQLLGLEYSARTIAEVEPVRIRHALATNFSDLLRYQNMLCRYDTMALKSLDIFSVHSFPVGLVQSLAGCDSPQLAA
jgi:adenine-specific DNA methylase